MTTPCADAITEAVVADLRSRSIVGVRKYGLTLADSRLPLREWLNHAYLEALDHAQYLKRAMAEIDAASTPVDKRLGS